MPTAWELVADGTRLDHADTLPRTVWVNDVGDDGVPFGRRAPVHPAGI